MLVLKCERDDYLRTKNRFYQCGWLDAERGEEPQTFKSDNIRHQKLFEDYAAGYVESYANTECVNAGVGC